jgi:hypothetical protein
MKSHGKHLLGQTDGHKRDETQSTYSNHTIVWNFALKSAANGIDYVGSFIE